MCQILGLYTVKIMSMLMGFNAKIIKLPENGDLTFPRKMLVWDNDESDAITTIVLWENKFGKPYFPFIAVTDGFEEAFNFGGKYSTTKWKHAKEIPIISKEKEDLLSKAEELIAKANELKEMASKLK